MSETRTEKYRELRETMRQDVRIDHSAIETVDEEDDFLSFLPKEESTSINEDLEPKSYEMLERGYDTQEALSYAKEGYENTRIDIFKKIQNDESQKDEAYGPYHASDLMNGHEVRREEKPVSFMDRIIAMSPDEDVEEFRQFQSMSENAEETPTTVIDEDDDVIETFVKSVEKEALEQEKVSLLQKAASFATEDIDEDEDEEDSRSQMIANIIIIVLVIVFVFVLFRFFF